MPVALPLQSVANVRLPDVPRSPPTLEDIKKAHLYAGNIDLDNPTSQFLD
ncbi:hypothetical protein FPV67DRAFT_1667802 [Lyophyllum atratum]|nr:hypothetical protein FPV67DRAFT_1667800 [Lyophyllum atratum]KAF8069891.1 hypothetical protein FPV67DRAFT_1667802 [Lyophyllum atratum]